uniref:Transporter n=1 Tax=Lutzomyia longipalpis TaxID=7200 RepID=A0A7G3B050_LUTLO
MKKTYGVSNGGFVASTDDLKAKQNGIEITEVRDPGESEAQEGAENRATWGNSIEFLMSCISMSVGLGNIWRFPFIAYENGGGAFLIPYIIVLIIVGKPMYYMEMILGQFTSRSSVKIWAVSPIFKGIGIGQMVGTCSVISYYCSMIGLTLNYLFSSFQSELPWSRCREEWGENCVDSKPNPNQTNIENGVSSSEFYFMKEVLKAKEQIDDGIGVPDWKMTLWLLLAWVLVFIIISRGVKSSGKAAYFLAIFPYVVMIILLIRACTLEGAGEGILFFIKPQFSELLNPKVWKEAVVQCFFSLATGMGPIIMFASYNNFHHNVYRLGGQWMLDLVDHYGGTFLIFALAVVELVAIFWVYGLADFILDTQFMCKRYLGIYWRYCWSFVTPVFMMAIFIYYMATLKPLTFGDSHYPEAAHVAGWILFGIGLLQLPLWASYAIGCRGSFMDNVRKSARPTEEWGPKNPKYYLEWKQFKADIKARNDLYNAERNYPKWKIALRNFFGIYVN